MEIQKVKTNKAQYNECIQSLYPIRDALDAIGGKWRIQILMAIAVGNDRFTSIQKALEDISPRILSKELKMLEDNKLIAREVSNSHPVTITYQWTDHTHSMKDVILALRNWGIKHRSFLFGKGKAGR